MLKNVHCVSLFKSLFSCLKPESIQLNCKYQHSEGYGQKSVQSMLTEFGSSEPEAIDIITA